MKSCNGESYEVRLDDDSSTVHFKGALRLSGTEDYAPILEMMRETLKDGATSTVDLRELDFLNSSGITMFSRFVIEARDKGGVGVQFVACESIPWHGRSLKNLQRLMPSLAVQLL